MYSHPKLTEACLQEVTIFPAAPSGITIAQPDVTLMLDLAGVIQEVTLSNGVSNEMIDAWRGQRWVDIVDDDASGKVMRMVADAREHGVSAFRQVNQRFPSGL